MVLTLGSRLGPYEVHALLGAGGMGEVYRARDTRLGREVAIKVLPAARMADENGRRRFVQEARAASALSHPNIVTIHEIGFADGIDFIVMEHVRGSTLARLIPPEGMPLADILRIAIAIADAVACAHAAGIIHRDLKPANVMVASEGAVKVLDFGLAKLVEGEAGSAGHEARTGEGDTGPLSRPGWAAGTVGYMSPEQATDKKVDGRSDIFSFGASLYEMVTGRRAFAADSAAETLAAVLREQPKSPGAVAPGVPRDLERLILRCLQKDPERRFQSMADVKVELNEIREELPRARVVAARHRRPLWLGAGLTFVLAVSVPVWLLIQSRGPADPSPTVDPLTVTRGEEWGPSFSPDGNEVAFVWDGEKGDNRDVYIKMVGSTETRRLTTDPAEDASPSWSPDGRKIAFLRFRPGETSGTIRLVSPLGGSDPRLSAAEAAWGPLSWSPDSRWLAMGGSASATHAQDRGIRFVAVPGGEVRSVTSPVAPTYHTEAAFSPDGRYLAYASCRSTGLSCHLDVVELDGDYAPKGAARRLTRKVFWATGLAWTRDGRSLVYADAIDRRLWRIDIAGDRAPRRIEIAGPGASWPTIARSRDRLAFTRSLSHANIYRVEAERPAELVAASSASDDSPDFSPDGRRFAWNSERGGRGGEIWLAAADGSNPVQLTHGPGLWQGTPRWSPDGRRIAFDSEGEDGYWHVWMVDAEGGSPSRLTQDPGDENLPSWSRDGRFVYFTSSRAGSPDIWRAPSTSGPAERMTRGGGVLAQESVDGKALFFTQKSEGDSPLFVRPLPAGAERQVLACVSGLGFTVGLAGVYHLACGADAASTRLYLLDPVRGRDRLFATLENVGGLRQITASPDGKAVLYARVAGEGSDLTMIENFK